MKPLDIFLNESVVLKEGYFEDTEAVSEIAKKYGCRMFPKGFSDFLNNGVGTFLYATMTCMNKEELEACCAEIENASDLLRCSEIYSTRMKGQYGAKIMCVAD